MEMAMTKMPKVTFFDNIVPFTTMKPKKNNTGKDMCNVCRVVVICRISQFCLSREVIGGDWFAKGRPSYNEQTLYIYIYCFCFYRNGCVECLF